MRAIMFGAYYCGYCAKIWDEVVEPLADEGYPIEYMDAMKRPSLARKYDVRNLPSTIIIDESGRLQETLHGSPDPERLRALLTRG